MGKNIDKRVWGVLGKQKTYFSPQKQVEGKTKTPLNANAFDSWDAKRSVFRRVDGYENAVQQGGVVPQGTAVPASSPTPTPTITQTNTPTPSITPTFTPTQTLTPSSTPYPLPLNPTIWYDASDSSTLTLINSGGTNYVSAWRSKGSTTWSLTGASTDTMPVLSASTLMPGNPSIVRFTTNATTTLRDYMVSFNNTPIGHTGSTVFQVWAKPLGSTYATALSNTRIYSGLTNGGIGTISGGAPFDAQAISTINNGSMSSVQTYASGTTSNTSSLSIPVYSAAALNDKFIFQTRTPLTAGQFATFELNQSGGTNTTAFTGTTVIPSINSFSLGVGNITTGGTITANNSSIELCEVMYFDTVLTNSQVEQVELYLKDKWRYDEWASPVPTPTQTASPTQTTSPTPTPSRPPFSPSSLSADIWIDFSDSATMSIRTSGSNSFLQSINNKGVDVAITGFSQTTAADQPKIATSTVFTGTSISAATVSNDWILNSSGITGNSWTTVMVIGRKSGTAVAVPATRFEWAGGNSATVYWNNTSTTNRQAIFSGSNTTYDFTNPITSTFSGQSYLQYFSSTGLTTVEYGEINGSGTTVSQSGSDRINWPASSTLYLLNENGATDDKQAEVGEIIMLRRELTSTEKTNLYNYLKNKWAITY